MFFIPISRWAIAPVFQLLDSRREPGLSNGTGRIKRGDAAHLPKELHLPKEVAVGMAIAGHPPHRSVREELPHTALAASRSRKRISG